jgi:hypothetical protein
MQLSFKTKGDSRGFVIIQEIASVYVDNFKSKMIHLTKTKRTQKLLHSLKVKGYTFRGKEFNWWNIKQILSNPFYAGVMKWRGETNNHNYDTIVSKRLYNLVNV